MRGQKAGIVISKPIQKQLSQVKVCTLKDAEMLAANGTISFLETENSNLRSVVNDLTAKISELQSNLAGIKTSYFRLSLNVKPTNE